MMSQLVISALINVKATENSSKVLTCYFRISYMSETFNKRTEERETLRYVSVNGKIILYWEENIWTELMWLSVMFIRSLIGTW
jgi:hypothetical protein